MYRYLDGILQDLSFDVTIFTTHNCHKKACISKRDDGHYDIGSLKKNSIERFSACGLTYGSWVSFITHTHEYEIKGYQCGY